MQVFQIDEVKQGRTRALLMPSSIRKSKAWLYLGELDRSLIELSEKGMPHRLIAQAVGVNAGTVSRRLAWVRTRLNLPLARCALDAACPLPSDVRMFVLLHTVGGQTISQIARAQRVTPAVVSERLTFARGMVAASRA